MFQGSLTIGDFFGPMTNFGLVYSIGAYILYSKGMKSPMLWINLSMDPLGDKWNKIVDVYFVNNDIHYALELLLQRIDQ